MISPTSILFTRSFMLLTNCQNIPFDTFKYVWYRWWGGSQQWCIRGREAAAPIVGLFTLNSAVCLLPRMWRNFTCVYPCSHHIDICLIDICLSSFVGHEQYWSVRSRSHLEWAKVRRYVRAVRARIQIWVRQNGCMPVDLHHVTGLLAWTGGVSSCNGEYKNLYTRLR